MFIKSRPPAGKFSAVEKIYNYYFCSIISFMSEKDFQNLMELAQKLLQENVSKEEAFRSLVRCGLLDEKGNLVVPEVAPYLAAPSVN
jgi:hypothetical protein